jgi:hypothetical protein
MYGKSIGGFRPRCGGRAEESPEALPANDRSGPVEVGRRQDELAVQALSAAGQEAYFEGKIAEIIIYNRSLNTSERQSVENYLNAKYARW